jgi:hypothetical protein
MEGVGKRKEPVGFKIADFQRTKGTKFYDS